MPSAGMSPVQRVDAAVDRDPRARRRPVGARVVDDVDEPGAGFDHRRDTRAARVAHGEVPALRDSFVVEHRPAHRGERIGEGELR